MAGQHSQRGQSAAELALLLPVVVLAFLVVVQIGLVARDQVLVNHAVREAARQVALDPSQASAAEAAASAVPGLNQARLNLELRGNASSGQIVTVELTYRSPTDVALVGAFIGDVELNTNAAVRIE